GMLPAGNLYASVNDMAKFLQFLFAGGKGVLKRATLEKMYTIQFPEKDKKVGFGLGFFVSDLEGKRVIRHGGAVYGFATEFAELYERDGKLYIFPHRGGMKVEVRQMGKDLIADDLHGYGLKIEREGDGKKLKLGKDTYEPITTEKPKALPAKWAGLIGEYGR